MRSLELYPPPTATRLLHVVISNWVVCEYSTSSIAVEVYRAPRPDESYLVYCTAGVTFRASFFSGAALLLATLISWCLTIRSTSPWYMLFSVRRYAPPYTRMLRCATRYFDVCFVCGVCNDTCAVELVVEMGVYCMVNTCCKL